MFYLVIDGLARVGFGFPLNDILGDAVAIVLATNTGEVFSFLSNLKLKNLYKILFPVLSIIIYIYQIKTSPRSKINKKGILFSSLLSLCLLPFIQNFPITKTINSLPCILENISSNEEYLKAKAQFNWNTRSTANGKSTVVIILGETTRGDHMYINGYSRNTTPKLAEEDIISFRNAISIGAHTLASTPYMLTRKEVSENWISKLWPEKSIISAFKEAGYVTYYISYLSNVHSGDNAINQIVNEADYYIRRPDEEGDYDMLGVPIIHNILDKDKADKKLIIYKLVGSHYNFHDRYPKNYAVFQPAFTKDNFNGPNPNQKDMFINTYDNSILYTDTVISDIIKLLKKESGDVSMSFISDHGVSIYEDGKTLYLNSKKANYNIACFFWMNNKAKE